MAPFKLLNHRGLKGTSRNGSVITAPAEDPSSGPSAHVRRFATAHRCRSRGISHPLLTFQYPNTGHGMEGIAKPHVYSTTFPTGQALARRGCARVRFPQLFHFVRDETGSHVLGTPHCHGFVCFGTGVGHLLALSRHCGPVTMLAVVMKVEMVNLYVQCPVSAQPMCGKNVGLCWCHEAHLSSRLLQCL